MDYAIEHIILNISVIALLLGWILDLTFGDPSSLPHPIVYMGKWIAFGERRLNTGRRRMLKGAVFTVASICMVFCAAWLLLHWLDTLAAVLPSPFNTAISALKLLVMTVLVFFCLAGKTLRREVRMVFEALDRSLDDGRKQVARIVGRDTQRLSRQEVSTAALETLAENLSDGVIAPLFWFALLGVPGMLAYKMVNTFDSMIGYQNARYKDFGCWAAHIDDIANFIPARITALLIVVCGWVYRRTKALFSNDSTACGSAVRPFLLCLRHTLRYARCHASPNSGWPEAALSAILDCRFGGPHDYFGELFYKPYIGDNAREITTADMHTSVRTCLVAEIIGVSLIIILYIS